MVYNYFDIFSYVIATLNFVATTLSGLSLQVQTNCCLCWDRH